MTTETQTTVLIKIAPSNDTQVIAFYEQAVGLQKYAEARVITTVDDLKPATDDLSLIAKIKKGMEGKRKDYLQPFQDHIKEINDSFKVLMEPIEVADKVTRSKILLFTADQDRIRREQEEINRLRLEASQREMELKGELSELTQLVEVLAPPPEHIRTELGTASTFKVRKWEVEDLSKVPLDYLMIDAAKVGKVVRAGIPFISGIHIWVEDSLRVNTK